MVAAAEEADSAAMEIKNSRRVLAVCLEADQLHLTRVVKDLTGSAPFPVADTLAGVTHDLPLRTPYYTATVPVWIDLVSDPAEWETAFLTEEAKEVLAVLGGFVLIFGISASSAAPAAAEARSLIESVGKVVKQGLGGWEWDGVGLAVGVGPAGSDTEEWDELCAGAGLEFVQVKGGESGRNEFGEKQGIERVKEALEANDWASLDASPLSDFGDFEDAQDETEQDGEEHALGYDPKDFEGMKQAIWSSGQEPQDEGHEGSNLADEDLSKVEGMMRRLQAVREAGEGMGEEQRRRMAARAVQDVMKEL